MARIKRAVNAQKKRRKVMKLAKGYWGAKSKQYRAATEQVRRSLRYAYIGRRLRKRDFRRLWIVRINAAARINGMSYSVFMNGLKKKNIDMNRKMLADLAVNDPAGFAKLVERKISPGVRLWVRRGSCLIKCWPPSVWTAPVCISAMWSNAGRRITGFRSRRRLSSV